MRKKLKEKSKEETKEEIVLETVETEEKKEEKKEEKRRKRKVEDIYIDEKVAIAVAKIIPFSCIAVATKNSMWNLTDEEAVALGKLWHSVLKRYCLKFEYIDVVLLFISIFGIVGSKMSAIQQQQKNKKIEDEKKEAEK